MNSKETTVSTTEFQCRLARRLNVTKAEAKNILDGVTTELIEAFKNGDRVLLFEFGSFTPRFIPGGLRSKVNSKEQHEVAPTKVIYFKLAEKQKDLINGRPYSKQIKTQKSPKQ